MSVMNDYVAGGGMHGLAAQSLYELLTTVSEGHPLANVAALMCATAPPSPDTWAQVLEVAGEIFSTAHKPEQPASETLERLQRHPPHLLTLTLILLAGSVGTIDPPLPVTLSAPLCDYLNRLQFRQLADQLRNDGYAKGLDGLAPEAIGFVYILAEKSARQSDNAKKGRPRKKPTLRSEFIAAMKIARSQEMILSVFIESVRAGSVDGLELNAGPEGSSRYKLNADAVSGDAVMVSPQTLKGWWNAAGKG